jgi:hypothetical protein
VLPLLVVVVVVFLPCRMPAASLSLLPAPNLPSSLPAPPSLPTVAAISATLMPPRITAAQPGALYGPTRSEGPMLKLT